MKRMIKPYYETEEYSEAENELDTYDDPVKLVMEYRISEKQKDSQIAELQKQLEETKQTGSYQVMLMCQKENILLKQQLKSQPAEIVEEIRKELGLKLKYKPNDEVSILKICNQINEVLDTILKEYDS